MEHPHPTPAFDDDKQIKEAFSLFDAVHELDPQREETAEGQFPAAILYAQRMDSVLSNLVPNPSIALTLAAHCQHIGRWRVPRNTFPMDRTGYLRWRTSLKQLHAEVAAKILHDVGFSHQIIERVATLLRKEALQTDIEMKLLEDTICVVFLSYYFDDFAAKHETDKVIGIVRKTWIKMSPVGQTAALNLALSESSLEIVKHALSPESS